MLSQHRPSLQSSRHTLPTSPLSSTPIKFIQPTSARHSATCEPPRRPSNPRRSAGFPEVSWPSPTSAPPQSPTPSAYCVECSTSEPTSAAQYETSRLDLDFPHHSVTRHTHHTNHAAAVLSAPAPAGAPPASLAPALAPTTPQSGSGSDAGASPALRAQDQSTRPSPAPGEHLNRRTAGLLLASLGLPAQLARAQEPTGEGRGQGLDADPGAKPGSASGGGGGVSGGGGLSRFAPQATGPSGQEHLDRKWRQQQQQREEGGQAGGGGGVARRERRAWPPVPLVALAPGLRVSKVIRGCWQLSGRHNGDAASDRTSGHEAMVDLAAFHRAGITTLDTADSYGPSELMIGQYLRLYPRYGPTTTVATKLSYLTDEEMQGVNRALVEFAVRGALARQGRQQLDLVQLQWADPIRHRRWLDVLKWLADLREEGLIGHLGLTNFSVPHMVKAAESGVGLVSNQVQFSLVDRRPQLYLQKAAASYGIKLLAYGTLAGGLLGERYLDMPADRVRLDTASKQKYGMLLRQAGLGAEASGGGWGWLQEVLAAARTVAERHGVTTGAVATAWVLQQPQVAAAVVGARNPLHLADMQAACALELDDGDMLDLDAVWEGVPNPPISDVYVWERGGRW